MKKILIILFTLSISLFAAFPNIFGEKPAISIETKKNNQEISNFLSNKNLNEIKENENQKTFIFDTVEEQIAFLSEIEKNLPQVNAHLKLIPNTPEIFQSINLTPMKLGLDLRGGVYFLLEVNTTSMIKNRIKEVANTIEKNNEQIQTKKLGESIIITGEKNRLSTIAKELNKIYHNDLIITANDKTLSIKFSEEAINNLNNLAISQNISTIKKRVNELGVSEPVVQRQGKKRISVEFPGIQDTKKAKDILGKTATLKFMMAEDDPSVVNKVLANPSLYKHQIIKDKNDQPVVLKPHVILSGNNVIDASAGYDDKQQPAVNIVLDNEGGDKMFNNSKNNIGKPMAVVFIEQKSTVETIDEKQKIQTKTNEVVISVASIGSALSNRFQITGMDSSKASHDLALMLRAGAMAAPVVIIEERTLGPSLGKKNIENGILAIELAFLFILIFMVVYYKVFGLLANIALLFNLVIVVAVMSLIGATLTLPGIAGLVLTVGMAVDANVLIFQRIKEEIKKNNSQLGAIDKGFKEAKNTILDANITTLIVAFILFLIGEGSVKGFAITLSIGIISSMFTSIFVVHTLANAIYKNKRKELRI